MMALFNPSGLLFRTVVTVGLAGAALYGFHAFCSHQQDIGYQRAQAEHEKLEAQRVQYAAKVEALQDANVLLAEQNATKRVQISNDAAAAAGVSADRLRRTLDNLVASGNTATLDALRASNATLAAVFQDCTVRYTEMGRNADGHANDVKTLMEAWPKGPPPAEQ